MNYFKGLSRKYKKIEKYVFTVKSDELKNWDSGVC